MSSISSIFPTTSTGSTTSTSATSATTPTAANPLAGMTTGNFLQIMLAQLQNQDPTQPEDPSTLMNEISSLENVQSQVSLQQQLQGLVSQDQLAQAGGLIGKLVTGTGSNNTKVSGIVTSVTVQNGAPILNLDSGQTLGMSNILTIAPASGTGTTGTATPSVATTPSVVTPTATATPSAVSSIFPTASVTPTGI